MKATNQVYAVPVIPVAKIYKPKFEITNVYANNEDGIWYLFVVAANENAEENTYRYKLDIYEN